MSFRVDTDLVADLAVSMASLDALFADQLAAVERRLGAQSSHWVGEAAAAYSDKHAQWQAGAAQMRQAVAELQAAALRAHGNYTGAVTANVGMWHG